MTTFDQLDWHLEAALEHGRPPQNAFTHIALYLAWIVRNGLYDPEAIPAALAQDVAAGRRAGSDLRDVVGDRLTAEVMSLDGAQFTDWYYEAYLDDFGVAFADTAQYAVSDDAAAYARIAPTIERRFADWLDSRAASGGSMATTGALTYSMDDIAAMTPADINAAADALAAALAPDAGGAARDEDGDGDGDDPPAAHAAPDLEALLPRIVGDIPMRIESSLASEWGSSLLRQAIENTGGDVHEAFVAIALGGTGEQTLAVTLYAIPGVPQDRLETEFGRPDYLPDGQAWERRDAAGKSVWWSAGDAFDTAFYALGGLVMTAGGSPERVLAALDLMP